MEEHAVLNVNISNFKGIKRCPYCGHKPEEMRWEDGMISMWCRNPGCNLVSNVVEVEYDEDDICLQDLTWELIYKWNKYCKESKKMVNA